MAGVTAYPQEAVLQATAFEIRFKFSVDMCWQAFPLSIELFNQGGVVFLYKLVEQSLLWAMAFIGGVTKGILAWRKHASSHLASGQCVSYTVG